MDTQSTSFIPKTSLTPSPVKGEGVGIFFVVGLLLFIMSIVAGGVAFAYQGLLNQTIASDSASLKKEQDALGLSAIQDLARTDNRLKQAKRLLGGHIAPSAILQFLGQETLTNVQYTNFDYSLQTDGTAAVNLSGIADSFAAVALQSDQLGSNKELKDVLFSNVNTDESGHVVFNVTMHVLPSLFLYSKTLQSDTSSTP